MKGSGQQEFFEELADNQTLTANDDRLSQPQGDLNMDWRMFFLNPAVVWVVIPVSYILVNGVRSLCQMYYEHVERIAMIQQGIMPPERSADASGLADL